MQILRGDLNGLFLVWICGHLFWRDIREEDVLEKTESSRVFRSDSVTALGGSEVYDGEIQRQF